MERKINKGKAGTDEQTKSIISPAKRMSGLNGLFMAELKAVYWIENILVKTLQKMALQADSGKLAAALSEHFVVTETQVERLQRVFSALGKKPAGRKCDPMAGVIREAEKVMAESRKGLVRDAGIIAAAQKVEHYEMACYGTLVAFARRLGWKEAADLLKLTLEEEKQSHRLLTEIVEAIIREETTSLKK
jgi:ferritin-like metal-binding protein YciE